MNSRASLSSSGKSGSQAFLRTVFLSAAVALFIALSGCSSGPAQPTVTPPTNFVYPQTVINATTGQAISSNTPSVGGTAPSFSVSPALPAGLNLSATTGVISGTPTAVTPQASYTITASNTAGSTTATVQITVIAPPVAPSALTYPQTTITATAGQPIATDTPTVTGTAPTFAITPALPAGLSISASTGAISGTPTTAQALVTYTVTASNTAGSTTAIVSITINPPIPAPSNLAYPQATITTAASLPISTDIPSVTGTVASFTVAPALPAGLSISASTGAISGTPTAASAQTTYTITAANSGGSTTASVVITVGKAVSTLLDLGHANSVSFMRSTSNRLLSEDASGHWVLWDYATSAELASGDQNGFPWGVDIAGSAIAVGLPNGVELRSATDGHLLTTIASPLINPPQNLGVGNTAPIPGTSWWKLASDGTYVCAGTKAGMAVWSLSGQLLASRQGDYSAAKVFAAPGQVQIALGAAGASVIETVSTSSGSSITGPAFSGNFSSWFYDGQRFLTNIGTTVWTYSAASVQQGIASLPSVENLGGNGNWFYVYGSQYSTTPLTIYPVGGSVPAATFPFSALALYAQITPSANLLGVTYGQGGYTDSIINIVDLSGSTPVKTDLSTPPITSTAFAANSPTQWTIGNNEGLILDGPSLSTAPRYYGYGAARSIAGSSNYIAVAVAKGTIPYFSASSLTPVDTIKFSSSSLALNSTGSVLAAFANTQGSAANGSDRTLNIYSLPSGSATNSWPSQVSSVTAYQSAFTMSADGGTLGLILLGGGTVPTVTREVVPTAGGPVIWSDNPNPSNPYSLVELSPDGSMFAVSTVGASGYTTSIFTGGQITTAVPGQILGWTDSTHILTSQFTYGKFIFYAGAAIYDTTGALTSNVNIPQIQNFLPVSSSSIYYPPQNTIYSLTNGSSLYTSPLTTTGVGAIAGTQVVFATGNRVVVDTY